MTCALTPGMADADAQAPVVAAAELGVDVLQAVVAGVRAAELELDLARHQVELVVDDEDLLRLDLEEARQRRDRLAREVHERRRLEQPHRPAGDVDAHRLAEVAALGSERGLQPVGDLVDEPEAGVVARRRVFGAGVAEACDESNHGVIIEAPAQKKAPRERGFRVPSPRGITSCSAFRSSWPWSVPERRPPRPVPGRLPRPRRPGRWPRRSPGSACRG